MKRSEWWEKNCRRLVALASKYDASEMKQQACVFCDFPYTVLHHLSYEKGETIPICPNCHFLLHFTNELDVRYEEMFSAVPPYKRILVKRSECDVLTREKLIEVGRKYNHEREETIEKHALEPAPLDHTYLYLLIPTQTWKGSGVGFFFVYETSGALGRVTQLALLSSQLRTPKRRLQAAVGIQAFQLRSAEEVPEEEFKLHDLRFEISKEKDATWLHPVIYDLWEAYVKYMKAKKEMPHDTTGIMPTRIKNGESLSRQNGVEPIFC